MAGAYPVLSAQCSKLLLSAQQAHPATNALIAVVWETELNDCNGSIPEVSFPRFKTLLPRSSLYRLETRVSFIAASNISTGSHAGRQPLASKVRVNAGDGLPSGFSPSCSQPSKTARPAETTHSRGIAPGAGADQAFGHTFTLQRAKAKSCLARRVNFDTATACGPAYRAQCLIDESWNALRLFHPTAPNQRVLLRKWPISFQLKGMRPRPRHMVSSSPHAAPAPCAT